MVCFWFGAVVGQCAQILGRLEAFWGRFEEDILELQGPKGPVTTGKSSCMIRVATISVLLAALSMLYTRFGQKKADFGPKL